MLNMSMDHDNREIMLEMEECRWRIPFPDREPDWPPEPGFGSVISHAVQNGRIVAVVASWIAVTGRERSGDASFDSLVDAAKGIGEQVDAKMETGEQATLHAASTPHQNQNTSPDTVPRSACNATIPSHTPRTR